MEGKEDPDNRRDFPGGFPGDKRSAFAAERPHTDSTTHVRMDAELDKTTKPTFVLERGTLIDLFYDDDAYAFARQDRSGL